MLNFASPLIALLWLVGRNTAQEIENYDIRQELLNEESKFFTSPNYPRSYRPGSICSWLVSSYSPIQLMCIHEELPKKRAPLYNRGSVIIQDGPTSRPPIYYGNKLKFELVSETRKLNITFKTDVDSRGGRFWCSVRAVQKDEGSEKCACGRRNFWGFVRDDKTGMSEYPMMAGLVDSQKVPFCGATIINERQVLTEARCVTTRNYMKIKVLVGDHDLSPGVEATNARYYSVVQILFHEKYERASDDFSAALVTIHGRITFNSQVGPVCLPFLHAFDSFVNEYVNALGWKYTATYNESRILYQERLKVPGDAKCNSTNIKLTGRQLYTRTENNTACEFHRGGPILWHNPYTKRLVQVGIIGTGGACGTNEPVVGVRVGEFIPWIKENLAIGTTYCPDE